MKETILVHDERSAAIPADSYGVVHVSPVQQGKTSLLLPHEVPLSFLSADLPSRSLGRHNHSVDPTVRTILGFCISLPSPPAPISLSSPASSTVQNSW